MKTTEAHATFAVKIAIKSSWWEVTQCVKNVQTVIALAVQKIQVLTVFVLTVDKMKTNPIEIFGDSLTPTLRSMIFQAKKEQERLEDIKARAYELEPSIYTSYLDGEETPRAEFVLNQIGWSYDWHWNQRCINSLSRWYRTHELRKEDIWEQKVEKARETSILSLFAKYVPNGNFDRSIKCPFHNDGSPSLKIYEKTNSWHCFGCGAGSNQIDFIMKDQNMDFKEAVDYLNSYH